jgi:hypothetical protein
MSHIIAQLDDLGVGQAIANPPALLVSQDHDAFN